MKRLAIMGEVARMRCSKCDYMNNEVPITQKKPNCTLSLDDICEIYLRFSRLKSRISYLKGEGGLLWMCRRTGGCEADDFSDGYRD